MTATTPRRAMYTARPSGDTPGGVTTARPRASRAALPEPPAPGGAHDTRRAIDLAVTISVPPAGYHHAGRQVSVVPLVSNASGIPLSRPAIKAPSPTTRAPGGVQLVERQDASEAQSSCALGVQPAGGQTTIVTHSSVAAGIYSRPAKVSALPMAVPRGGSGLTGGRLGIAAQRTIAAGVLSRPTGIAPTPAGQASGGHLLAGRQTVSDAQGADAAGVQPADRHLGIACSQGTYAVGPYSRLPNQLAVTTAHPADGALHAGHHLSVDARGANVASVQPADRQSSPDAQAALAVGFYSRPAKHRATNRCRRAGRVPADCRTGRDARSTSAAGSFVTHPAAKLLPPPAAGSLRGAS